MISVETLVKMDVGPTQARIFAPHLDEACTHFGIVTAKRIAAFIAQVQHESANFTQLEELLYYRDPERIVRIFRSAFDLDQDKVVDPEEIEFAKGYVRNPQKLANRAYAMRNGNGDEDSGDGWTYRGSGPIQLTGKKNFAICSTNLGIDFVANPGLLREPKYGSWSAAWFWTFNGCNSLADEMRFDVITRAINGPAMLGAKERREQTVENLHVLSGA